MINDSKQIRRSRLTITSLIVGILAFVFSIWPGIILLLNQDLFIVSIPILFIAAIAIVCGHVSLRRIRLSNGTIMGRGKSIGGLVLGYGSILVLTGFTFVSVILPRLQFAISGLTNPPNYEVLLQLQGTPSRKVTPLLLKETEKVLSARLRYLGAPHRIKSAPPDKLIVRLRLVDASKERNALAAFETKLLSFHLVHRDNESMVEQMYAQDFTPPNGFKLCRYGDEFLFVEIEPVLVDDVDDAKAEIDYATSKPVIAVRFGPEGTKRLSHVTQENIGGQIAIMLDQTVYSVSVISGGITKGRMQIMGNFSMEEALDIAVVLRSGAVPLPIHVIEGHFLKQ